MVTALRKARGEPDGGCKLQSRSIWWVPARRLLGYGTFYTDSLMSLRPWGAGSLNAPAGPRLLFQRAHPLLKGPEASGDLHQVLGDC